MYEPSIGDAVTFNVNGEPASGIVDELLGNAVAGVRVTEEGNEFQGQRVYFNARELAPVTFRGVR